jgi:DNA-binding CsgD family transcriptional regulator
MDRGILREELPVADGTIQAALAPLAEPFDDVHVVDPDPSVAVAAEPPLLRRRILAALDFDRLPVIGAADAPSVFVVAAEHDAAVPEARQALPGARVVVVLERLRGGPLRRALRAGAMAAVDAAQIETTLALAVRGAAAGLVVVPEAMRERLEPPALSPREREVLALAAEGATTSEIADRLTVSPGTVKRHLSSCFAKLGVENRGEALALLIDADRDPSAPGIA